jgi:general secretion pathway protein H
MGYRSAIKTVRFAPLGPLPSPLVGEGLRERWTIAFPSLRSRGFTLIEILVVVLIISAVLGMVTLRLTRDDRDLVRDEADRLVLLLQTARDEAILQGGLLALEMKSEGYRFLRPDEKGKFAPISESPLGPRELPVRMDVRLEIEGQLPGKRQSFVFDPGGTLPAFSVVFTLNDARWWVIGAQDGTIRSLPRPDAQTS